MTKDLVTKHFSKMCLYERMRFYQDQEKNQTFDLSLNILVVRISFKNIKKFAKVFQKPFDDHSHKLLEETAKHLLLMFKGKYAHVGNNDITLILHGNINRPIDFGNKKQKLVSNITSAVVSFYTIKLALTTDVDSLYDCGIFPIFETIVYNIPNINEAGNVLLWRERENNKGFISTLCKYINKETNTHYVHYNNFEIDHSNLCDQYHSKFKYGLYIKLLETNNAINKYSLTIHYDSFSNTTIEERNRRIFS